MDLQEKLYTLMAVCGVMVLSSFCIAVAALFICLAWTVIKSTFF